MEISEEDLEGDHGEYVVGSLDEAIQLAERFKAEGRYDWFRGQTHMLPPRCSLARLEMRDPGNWQAPYLEKISRYQQFLEDNPELAPLAADPDAALAVAQHYGIPTTLIDFTTEPSVAAFFACDTSRTMAPDAQSCIYCLDTKDLADMCSPSEEEDEDAFLFAARFIHLDVPNLWRIESQHGVFLEIRPANWDEFYPMDRIIFPYQAMPVYPPREVIYPVHKSALEILLDQFLAAEKSRAGGEAFLEMVRKIGAPINHVEPPPDRINPALFRSGTLEVHSSWAPETLAEWRDSRVEKYHRGADRMIPLALNPALAPDRLGASAATAVQSAIRTLSGLRDERVQWQVRTQPLCKALPDNNELESALRICWDGMRRLPYTSAQLATAMGRLVELFALGLHLHSRTSEERTIAEALLADPMTVEFGAPDGSYTSAMAASSAIKAAWRDDLADLLAPEHAQRMDNPHAILMGASDPRRLFDFHRLSALFPEILIPWQLLATNREPIFFSPARLNAFGLK